VRGSRNYNHHMESRNRDLETVSRLRTARLHAVGAASRGEMESLLRHSTPEASQVYVVKLFDVHPRFGKVAGRRLLAQLNVPPFARVANLSSQQVDALLRAVGEPS
jgi:hypothetical protein